MDIEEFLSFYNSTFKPAYADLVSYISDKPLQIIVEIENAFAHLCVYLDEKQFSDDREDNLKKAYSHIQRATLDCYKLLWVKISEDIDSIIKDSDKRKFTVNLPEEELLKKWKEFKQKASNARSMELNKIGLNKIEDVVNAYQEMIAIGWEIVKNIDSVKEQEFRKLSIVSFIKKQWIGFVLGVASSLAATMLINLFIT